MSYSSVFGDELDALGIWWPRGDGSALRSAGQAWQLMADYLDDTTAALNTAAGRVVEHHDGDAADAFTALWSEWSGDPGHLEQTSADCRRLVRSLIDFAGDVDAADRTIAQLVELALGSLTATTATNATTTGSTGATSAPMMSGGSLLALDDVWRQWLADSASAVGRNLATCAVHTGADAAGCAVVIPPTPGSSGTTIGPPPPVIDTVHIHPDGTICPGDHHPDEDCHGGYDGPGDESGDDAGDDPGDTASDDVPDDDPGSDSDGDVDDIDLDLVDPDEIDWVDPGTPDDLSHLDDEPIDFGHGEGPIADPAPPVVPGPTTPYPTTPYPTGPIPGSPYPGLPGQPGFGTPPSNGPVTITVNGDGSVVNVVSGDNANISADTDVGSPSTGVPFAPPPSVLPDAVPDVVPEIADLGGVAGFSGGGGGFSGGGGGYSGGSLDLPAFEPPVTALPEAFEPATRSMDVLSLTPTDVTALGGTGLPTDAVPAASTASGSGGSSRMPFMPMMPMSGMGGGGGDDQEPRRRRMKVD